MTTFDDIDDESAAMILQLQIEDSDEIFAQLEGNGKRPEGLLSDDQLAFQILKEELERDAATLKDRQMTKSIADACRTDGNILTATQSEEQTAANDHEIACRLAGTQLPAPIQPWTITAEQIDEELLAKLSALYVSVPTESDFSELEGTNKHSDSESGDAESSAWAATRTNPKALSRRCTVCYENVRFFDTARVPCGHEYCRECLQDLYRASMTDDSLFPPRCCKQPITSGGVRIFLTSDIIAQYEQKKIEVETPDRTYCSNPTCSVFIRSANIVGDQGTCSVCTTTTCTICKAASHTGDCPSDTALAQLLETANENGWQRCFSCRSVVDLEIGCNHMFVLSIFGFIVTDWLLLELVAVVHSSAMFAERNGGNASVTSGTRTVCLLVQLKW